MDDIRNLFKETIAEFIENGLKAELDDELGYRRGWPGSPTPYVRRPPAYRPSRRSPAAESSVSAVKC